MAPLPEEELCVDVGGATTRARVYAASRPGPALLLAPGAGAPQAHPFMVAMARATSALGIETITFDFLYAAAGRRAPDRPDVLEATLRAVVAAVRRRGAPARLFLGGKSMGGRIATQVVARGEPDVAGLVLLGYPLHPPGHPERPRTAHLPRITVPMLFVQGSRDLFGTPAELEPVLRTLTSPARLMVIEGGDHSFATPKKAGTSPEVIRGRVADAIARFTA